jgi:hypothetical protein
MTDNLKKRTPADAARINVNEAWELRYWSKTLKVTPERLKELVKEHGVSARKIREVLGIQPVAPKPRSKKIA